MAWAPLDSRYLAPSPSSASSGWRVERLTPASRLFGANGIRSSSDGRIYVAQLAGSQISAIDIETGSIETISPLGGDIVAPDDLVFDPEGNLYVTEISKGRVSERAPNGITRVICGDIPVANPITFYRGRLFAGECRIGGRIMELSRSGGAPRILAENVPFPNAFEVGPDGKLYFPVMGTNEIWRINLAGGAPETVATGLGLPDAVKFDAHGFIVSTQIRSGQVLRIDPHTGEHSVLANLSPGLDNLTFVGERIFVSNMTGCITEILPGGMTKELVPNGFVRPLGLAMSSDDVLYVADGPFSYTLRPGRQREVAGMLFDQGYPGLVRGVAAAGRGEFLVTTVNGAVARFRPAQRESEVLAEGFDQLFGVAVAPSGAVVFAELGTGRVHCVRAGKVETLATDLTAPKGVTIGMDGTCYVSESGAGRVVQLVRGRAEIVLDGLAIPEGIVVRGQHLYAVDAGSKDVTEYDLASGTRRVIASDLPIGAPKGVTPKLIGAIGTLAGPTGPFAAIAAGGDGALYVSGDAEGSVLALRPA